MKNNQKFLKSFGNAGNGLKYFFLHERNGKVQVCIGCVAIAAAFFLHISRMEWIAVLLCTGIVLSLEMVNSAIEKLCDLVESDYNPAVR